MTLETSKADFHAQISGKGWVDFEIPPKQRRIIPIRMPEKMIDKTNSPQLASPTSSTGQLAPLKVQSAQVVRPTPPSRTTIQTPSSREDEQPVITDETKNTFPPNKNDDMTSNLSTARVDSAFHRLPDVFSPIYVPLWLQAVNESSAALQPCTAFPTLDFASYIATIVGADFVREVPQSTIPPPTWSPIVDAELTYSNYTTYWLRNLQKEFSAQCVQYKNFALYKQRLQPLEGRAGYFVLHVPGLRENSPRIDLGDTVHIRVLGTQSKYIQSQVVQWLHHGRNEGVICPGFTGLLYDPQVWEIDRQSEKIVLRMDTFRNLGNCNIIFVLQNSKLEPICRAVQGCPVSDAWFQRILFPKPGDGIQQTSLSTGRFNISWFDELNWEQKKAVHTITSSNYGNVPYLISGPPGTGKTKTLVETALQLLQTSGHVLICAPSDAAADILALRLSQHLTPESLFRLNSWTRTFAEVPDRLLLYTYSNGSSFSLPPVERMLSFRAVVTTCRDADILNRARLSNCALSSLYNGVKRLLVPGAPVIPLHWTALLLDEAAQATEPDALIPLTVVIPPDESQYPQFVAAGDQYQLGPKLVSKSKLSISLFQRLFERPFYNDHPLSRKNGNQRLTSNMLPLPRPAFTNLIRNYRSHPAILSVPSSLFYNDTLITERKGLLSWSRWPSKEMWPVLFKQNNSADAYESVISGDGTGAGALYNLGEAVQVVSIVKSLLERADKEQVVLHQKEIMIMSPFIAQVTQLRKSFRENNMFEVNIGPLEAFQGLESRIIIICTTRTRLGNQNQSKCHHVRIDQSRGLGLIDEPQRLNVAMTRAKEGLIVIGDVHCLGSTGDVHWLAFLDFCKRNNCFEAPADFEWPELGGPYVSGRLERALNYASLGKANDRASSVTRSWLPTSESNSNFKLKGKHQEMDEEMWQFKELAQLRDSEIIDLMLPYPGDDDQGFENREEKDDLEGDFDRDLHYEFYRDCTAQ